MALRRTGYKPVPVNCTLGFHKTAIILTR